jgi:membrane-bound lytic murein transglycosylase A
MNNALKIATLGYIFIALSACTSAPSQSDHREEIKPAVTTPPCLCNESPKTNATPETKPPASTESAKPTEAAKLADYSLLKPISWDEIEGFDQDNLRLSWPAWQQSCTALTNKPQWTNVCETASLISIQTDGKPDDYTVLNYFKAYFSVYKTTNIDGSDNGLITGYYEPILKGSRIQSPAFPYPLYAQPADLITVALDTLYPELKYKRIRGRLVGNKLIPYYSRAEIEAEQSPIKEQALIYIDDIIDAFFLQIQGSGLVQLENGEEVHIGYADQNGHAYQSIGQLLIARGELKASEASMQGIKNWARNNLNKVRELLNSNPSYVFFRELPKGLVGPLGALGVPLLGEQAIAVDAKFIPLGAPVFLSTTAPNSIKPLKKLMMAQDTGGAIKGGVRADFYWGSGVDAGEKAGAMKQTGKMWVLLPKDFILPN